MMSLISMACFQDRPQIRLLTCGHPVQHQKYPHYLGTPLNFPDSIIIAVYHAGIENLLLSYVIEFNLCKL